MVGTFICINGIHHCSAGVLLIAPARMTSFSSSILLAERSTFIVLNSTARAEIQAPLSFYYSRRVPYYVHNTARKREREREGKLDSDGTNCEFLFLSTKSFQTKHFKEKRRSNIIRMVSTQSITFFFLRFTLIAVRE